MGYSYFQKAFPERHFGCQGFVESCASWHCRDADSLGSSLQVAHTFLGHSVVLKKNFPAELLGPGFLYKINLGMVEMSQDAACVCKAGDPSPAGGSAQLCRGLAHV